MKLRRIDLVVVPMRGKKRTYALSRLTVDPETFKLVEFAAKVLRASERRRTV